jgi:MarR family transcriptional regulator, organic hydroperoxide resistance regulator
VAAVLHVTTPTIVKMATRMSAVGLLTPRRDDKDNRLVRLWLTDAGRALRKPIETERRLIEEKLTANLTPSERRHPLSALAKIHHTATNLAENRADRDEAGDA